MANKVKTTCHYKAGNKTYILYSKVKAEVVNKVLKALADEVRVDNGK